MMNKIKRRRLWKSKEHKKLLKVWICGLPDPS